MGSSHTTQSNEPPAWAKPSILHGLNLSDQVSTQQQPILNQYAKDQQKTYGMLAPGATAGITGAQGLVNDTLGGKYLNGNPYIDSVINRTNQDVTNGVSGQFEAAGRYGSGAYAGTLAQHLADADGAIRYQNYAQERQNQVGSVDQAQGLMNGATSLENNAAELPWIGVGALNGNVRQASDGYGTRTTTSNPGLLSNIEGAVGTGLKAYSTFGSDERLKDLERLTASTPDGLRIYDYTLKSDPSNTPQTGVLAQDVAKMRPDALGPTAPDGTMSVNYGKLGLPDPTTLSAMIGRGGGDAPPVPTQAGPQGLLGAGQPQPQQVAPQATPAAPQGLLAGGSANAAALKDNPMAGNFVAPGTMSPPGQIPVPGVQAANLPAAAPTPSFADRLFSPDPTTTKGKIGLFADQLLASSGAPWAQSLGNAFIGSRKEQSDKETADAKNALETAKTGLEIRKLNAPQFHEVPGVGLVAASPDGTSAKTLVAEQEKSAPLPAGVTKGPDGTLQYDPSVLSPRQVEEFKAQQAKALQDHSDARLAQTMAHSDAMQQAGFAHSDASQARALAAVSARGAAKLAAGQLDPDTLKFAVGQYLAGDKSVLSGFGKSPGTLMQLRTGIASEATARGLSPAQVATKLADFAADSASLKQQVKTADVTKGNETTAAADLDRWAAASKKIPIMGVGLLDRAQQSLVGNNPILAPGTAKAIADEQTAREDVHQKVTKVISQNTTGAAATDALQRRADTIFNGTDPYDVKISRLKQLLGGMVNQTGGQQAQIATTRARLSGVPAPAPVAHPNLKRGADGVLQWSPR